MPSASGMTELLRVEHLEVAFRSRGTFVRAVDGVSLSVGAGETVSIVGESGSGKSTLARAIVGLLPRAATVKAQSLRFDDAIVPQERWGSLRGRSIAMIFQDPLSYLNPSMTIERQISESIMINDRQDHVRERVQDHVRERIEELLEYVRLPRLVRKSYPHELSGGMRQRVLIAIALACRPRLLIADEPTTALDVTTQAEILDLLDAIRNELGMAMLLVTHDLGVAKAITRRVYVMLQGKVVEHGPAEQVLSKPQTAYTEQLVRSARAEIGSDGRFITSRSSRVQQNAPLLTGIRKATVFSASSAPSVAMRDDTPVLLMGGVSVVFTRRGAPPHHAVRNVSLAVYPGEIVAIVGESGSGKTTISKVALGLQRPDQGDVQVNSVSLLGRSGRELNSIRTALQPVFQDSSAALNPRRTIRQLLMQALSIGSVDGTSSTTRLTELLEAVELRPGIAYLERFPHELSGGQRQRIAIARAVAANPSLIVADEPLSGADVSIRGQILNLLLDLQGQRRMAYLFITHDIILTRSFAHRVIVLYQGEIVEQGSAETVIGAPSHPYTQRLVASALRYASL